MKRENKRSIAAFAALGIVLTVCAGDQNNGGRYRSRGFLGGVVQDVAEVPAQVTDATGDAFLGKNRRHPISKTIRATGYAAGEVASVPGDAVRSPEKRSERRQARKDYYKKHTKKNKEGGNGDASASEGKSDEGKRHYKKHQETGNGGEKRGYARRHMKEKDESTMTEEQKKKHQERKEQRKKEREERRAKRAEEEKNMTPEQRETRRKERQERREQRRQEYKKRHQKKTDNEMMTQEKKSMTTE